MTKQIKSEDSNNNSSDSTTGITTSIYIPNHLYQSLQQRTKFESIDFTHIFNSLVDLFIKSGLSFLEFKYLVTQTFKISYDPSSMQDSHNDKAFEKYTFTISLKKDNHIALKKYVSDNKHKEYGISFSSICVTLAYLLTLSNTYLHVFVKEVNDAINNNKKKG